MSTRTKTNIWWAIERLGLPTFLCAVLWYGFTGVVEQSRSDSKEMNVQVLSTTKEVTTALTLNNEIQRRQLDQQEDTERAIERQTVIFDKLCDRLGTKEAEE